MENNLDKLFKSKLEGQEPKFHPAAWDRMESLLEEEGMVPPPKKKSRRAGIIIFFIFLIGIVITGIGYIETPESNAIGEGSTIANQKVEPHSTKNEIQKSKNIPETKTEQITDNYSQKSTSQTHSPDQQLQNEKSLEERKSQFTNQVNPQQRADENRITHNSAKSIENESIINSKNFVNVVSSSLNSDTHALNEKFDQESASKNKGTQNSIPTSKNVNQITTPISVMNSSHILNEAAFFNPSEVRDIRISPIRTIDIDEIECPKTSFLLPPFSKSVFIQDITKSPFSEFGIQINTRINNGAGYSIGPFVSYQIGNGYSISFAGQLDVQSFSNGPELTVFDKEYSFGSTITERSFSLNNQKSISIPISISKSFERFSIKAGLSLNKPFITTGSVLMSNDGSKTEGLNIENELIKSFRVSFFSGASFRFSRHFMLDVGLEYRPGVFIEDPATNYTKEVIYPTLGLRYSLFKI